MGLSIYVFCRKDAYEKPNVIINEPYNKYKSTTSFLISKKKSENFTTPDFLLIFKLLLMFYEYKYINKAHNYHSMGFWCIKLKNKGNKKTATFRLPLSYDRKIRTLF